MQRPTATLAYELAISLRNPCRNLGHRFTLQSTPSTLHDPLASYSRAALGNGWTTRKAIQGPSNNVVELRSFHFGLVYTENSNTLELALKCVPQRYLPNTEQHWLTNESKARSKSGQWRDEAKGRGPRGQDPRHWESTKRASCSTRRRRTRSSMARRQCFQTHECRSLTSVVHYRRQNNHRWWPAMSESLTRTQADCYR